MWLFAALTSLMDILLRSVDDGTGITTISTESPSSTVSYYNHGHKYSKPKPNISHKSTQFLNRIKEKEEKPLTAPKNEIFAYSNKLPFIKKVFPKMEKKMDHHNKPHISKVNNNKAKEEEKIHSIPQNKKEEEDSTPFYTPNKPLKEPIEDEETIRALAASAGLVEDKIENSSPSNPPAMEEHPPSMGFDSNEITDQGDLNKGNENDNENLNQEEPATITDEKTITEVKEEKVQPELESESFNSILMELQKHPVVVRIQSISSNKYITISSNVQETQWAVWRHPISLRDSNVNSPGQLWRISLLQDTSPPLYRIIPFDNETSSNLISMSEFGDDRSWDVEKIEGDENDVKITTLIPDENDETYDKTYSKRKCLTSELEEENENDPDWVSSATVSLRECKYKDSEFIQSWKLERPE